MNKQIEQVKAAIEPLRQQIINHKVYPIIKSIKDLQVFMQHHIYAVWDFMSLLKALQNNLTCTTIPWFPKGDAATRFLINEIVIGEESDVDMNGVRKSHFELYLDAMAQSGANLTEIHTFIETLQASGKFDAAFAAANVPATARSFMDFTFRTIASNKAHVQAAVFTFGREDLIPDMFHSIINDLYEDQPAQVATFKYYLERHIEVDGDHHSHLALEMTASLCGNDPQRWQEVEAATVESLQKRIMLWDGVYDQIIKNREATIL